MLNKYEMAMDMSKCFDSKKRSSHELCCDDDDDIDDEDDCCLERRLIELLPDEDL